MLRGGRSDPHVTAGEGPLRWARTWRTFRFGGGTMRSVKELLKELKARSASEVTVGKSPAVAGSSDPALAAERSRELAEHPQFLRRLRREDERREGGSAIF